MPCAADEGPATLLGRVRAVKAPTDDRRPFGMTAFERGRRPHNQFLGEASEGAAEAPSDDDGGRSPPPSSDSEPA